MVFYKPDDFTNPSVEGGRLFLLRSSIKCVNNEFLVFVNEF